MTAIFRGAEDINFSPIAGPTVDTSNGRFRSGYARCGLAGAGAQRWRCPASFGLSNSNFWFTERLWSIGFAPIGNPIGQNIFLTFNSAGDVARIYVGGAGGWGNASLTKVDAAGNRTLLATGSGPLAFNGLQKIDVQMNYAVGGSFTLYADGDILISFAGDLTTDGNTSIVGFDLTDGTHSEVIWDTSDTRSMGLVSIVPNASGVSAQWTGTFSDVNAIVNADNTFNSTNTNNQTQLYNASDLPSTEFSIVDFTLSARAGTNGGSPQHLDPSVYTNGSQFNNTAWSLGLSLQPYFSLWTTNPSTGLPWTPADINALQEGFESAA